MDSDISSAYRCVEEDFLHLNFKYLNTTFTLCKFISLIKNKEQMEKGDKIYLLINNLYLKKKSQIFRLILLLYYYMLIPEVPHTLWSYVSYINPMALTQAGITKTDNFSWFEGLFVPQCAHSRCFNGNFSRSRVHAYTSLNHTHLQTPT